MSGLLPSPADVIVLSAEHGLPAQRYTPSPLLPATSIHPIPDEPKPRAGGGGDSGYGTPSSSTGNMGSLPPQTEPHQFRKRTDGNLSTEAKA